MAPNLTAMLVGGGQLLGPSSSTGDTGFSYTQDSGMSATQEAQSAMHVTTPNTDYSQKSFYPLLANLQSREMFPVNR